MELGLHANMVDEVTGRIADILHAPFEQVSRDLNNDYGGSIEHLWIDFELIRDHGERRPPFSFRYQKRVSGNDRLTGIRHPDRQNVGHYSVRPDFTVLLNLPDEQVPIYALRLIYDSTAVLHEKSRKLGGFDAERFRFDFLEVCRRHGCEIAGQLSYDRPGFLTRLQRKLFS